MKNKLSFLSILLTLFLAGSTLAQGNLQFNQVRKLQWPQTTVGPHSGQSMGPYIVTVPAGKVLKIESINVSAQRTSNLGYSSALGAYDFSFPASIFLEETMVYSNPGGSGTAPQSNVASNIIWLPAGDHNFYIYGSGNGVQRTFSALITAIEFNIVP